MEIRINLNIIQVHADQAWLNLLIQSILNIHYKTITFAKMND